MKQLPFEGIRVVEFTAAWAGPMAAELLSFLGAEVIKIESIQRLDWWRTGVAVSVEDRTYERASTFNTINRNKYEITLDLKDPRGKQLFERLVGMSDILVDNFSAHVLPSLGLTYEMLSANHPELIMLAAPAFGSTGSWKDYPGYGVNVDEIAGLAALTGYPGGPPEEFGMGNLTDPLVGIYGGFALVIALRERRRTGKGQLIDISHIEASATFLGEALLDYTVNGRIWPRMGNRHPTMAPHGIYRCAGDDDWVAIAVGSDDEWQRLCRVIGNETLQADPRFADAVERHRHQDELDPIIESWTRSRKHLHIQQTLQEAGVPAGAVLTPGEVLADPHFQTTGHFEYLDREYVGRHPYPALPMKFSRLDTHARRPAPTLGEHNASILRELLGLSDEEFRELERDQVIGTEPLLAGV